jgi:catechol 2,3-dioxygenase-like lactoylglutathione lyase family enzyme
VTKASINHVSIRARDLEESARFYIDLFGAEKIATPNFGFPVQWLRLGDLQLHLFQRDEGAPTYHHFALAVDDFDRVFDEIEGRGMFDRRTMGRHLTELPSGQVQLYLRDPGGNLVEVNFPDVSRVKEEARAQMLRLEEAFPQDESNRQAVLYLELEPGITGTRR